MDDGSIYGEANTGNEWVDIDVSGKNIEIKRNFFISMYWIKAPGSKGSYAQFLGYDTTNDAGRTFWKYGYGGYWVSPSSSYPGNSMIRAEVSADTSSLPQTLSINMSTRTVSNEPGTTTFSVSNTGNGTMTWSASVISGSNWLSIQSGSSGSNSGTIVCSYSANTTTSSRTATIRITATGATGSPTDVMVIQGPSTTQVFTLNVNSSHGTVTKNPDKTSYDSNEVVILTATPETGYKFTGWSGDAYGNDSTTTVTMTGNKTAIANFEPSNSNSTSNYKIDDFSAPGVSFKAWSGMTILTTFNGELRFNVDSNRAAGLLWTGGLNCQTSITLSGRDNYFVRSGYY
ncbi:MAG: BACON domain-containing protein [Desulfamplus sp.]|nr:BACON domain-containing protein [Desulfamplus sp.]